MDKGVTNRTSSQQTTTTNQCLPFKTVSRMTFNAVPTTTIQGSCNNSARQTSSRALPFTGCTSFHAYQTQNGVTTVRNRRKVTVRRWKASRKEKNSAGTRSVRSDHTLGIGTGRVVSQTFQFSNHVRTSYPLHIRKGHAQLAYHKYDGKEGCLLVDLSAGHQGMQKSIENIRS